MQPVTGVRLGHWTDAEARTGCSVLLFDPPVLAAADVRGAAPATRELETLAPGGLVQRADALLFTGGSAFGLAAADGVMRYLRELQRGFPTAGGPVPIVPTAAIFDLTVGRPVSPDARAGYEACRSATPLHSAVFGQVGAGAGARFGAVRGPDHMRAGAVDIGQYATGDTLVTALVVLNAFGSAASHLAAEDEDPRREYLSKSSREGPPRSYGEHSTLIAVIVDGPCDHRALIRTCVAAHDGLAHRIVPCHTDVDGDVVIAVGLGAADGTLDHRLRLAMATELAVERAIDSAVAQ